MCNTDVETWQRILQCTSIHASKQLVQSISSIKKELNILKTCLDLLDYIIDVITTYIRKETPTPPPIDFKPYPVLTCLWKGC